MNIISSCEAGYLFRPMFVDTTNKVVSDSDIDGARWTRDYVDEVGCGS